MTSHNSTDHDISDSESEPEMKPDMDSDTDSDVTIDLSEAASTSQTVSSSHSQSHTNSKRRQSDSDSDGDSGDLRPECQYGTSCYRRNPSHFKQFQHPWKQESLSSSEHPVKRCRTAESQSCISSSTATSSSTVNTTPGAATNSCIMSTTQPIGLLLTQVRGIEHEHNAFHAIDIKEILSTSMGHLKKSAQFNYKIDIPWLVSQYAVGVRSAPLLVIHGAQRSEKAQLDMEASAYSHIQLAQARLEMMYGTHHTKMMLLLYSEGLKVVIHTANLIQRDWHQKTQGVWISPLFPKLTTQSVGSSGVGDSITLFKKDLLEYLAAYKLKPLEEWMQQIREHDLSAARVHIIGSVPGRHVADRKTAFGHLKLRKVLEKHGPAGPLVTKWPVVGQFSSVGSLGASPDVWLCKEWLHSMATVARSKSTAGLVMARNPPLQLIYPSKENVRQSLEGYAAGGSLPYSINVAKKQPYLHGFMHQWRSTLRGRTAASPHIKTYLRYSPDLKHLAWFLLTSANMSKAAWGALEKNETQLMIRSYELGVLFLPENFGDENTFQIMQPSNKEQKSVEGRLVFPLPYDLPPTAYTSKDRPWIWDIPYVDKPDTHGTKWCPP